ADPAGIDTVRLRAVRRRFLCVASAAAAARQFSRALERDLLFRAHRPRRCGAVTLSGGLCVVAAAGGPCARLSADRFDRRVDDRSRNHTVRMTAGSLKGCRYAEFLGRTSVPAGASVPSVRPSRPIAVVARPTASTCWDAFARPRSGMLL